MHYTKRLKRNNTIISIDTEKAFDKIKPSFVIEISQKTRHREKLLQLHFKKCENRVNLILNSEN